MTRALLLSTYVKFINLFPEVKTIIQEILKQDSNLRSADAELQQRASEYLQLSKIVSTDVLVGYFLYLMKYFLICVSVIRLQCWKRCHLSQNVNHQYWLF